MGIQRTFDYKYCIYKDTGSCYKLMMVFNVHSKENAIKKLKFFRKHDKNGVYVLAIRETINEFTILED